MNNRKAGGIMSQKTVPLSVRIPHKDAEFIASLKIDGCITPSEKVRALITEARTRAAQAEGYVGNVTATKELLAPALQKVQSQENVSGKHSELVKVFSDWLPDSVAFLASSYTIGSKDVNLEKLEEGAATRIFRLMDSILRMGVTQKAPCYDKEIISKKVEPMVELMEIVNEKIKKNK
jgi:hypothetical protein